ncbi:MAG: DNA-binding protein [Gammaproteobacteria bacterium]|nr:DNA-binding protein [Gammaproteobacteria bacterium]MBT8109338.1 DNA-binding protein [Gammaproteobacteria bacterium]NNL44040.1 DNA-binding protein [Woeseiaceae bacterium]
MNSAPFNLEVAGIFRNCAEVLRQQAANPFRVNAYIHAAQTLESLEQDTRDILRNEGIAGLVELPAIGQGLAASIDEIARTGRLLQLDRLRGETAPANLFRTVPGIGPKLAHAIHDELHVDTLEELEVAAHDGRLAAVAGIGDRRVAAVQAGLAALLGRGRSRRQAPQASPPAAVLLDVDREYRQRAAAGKLPKIAPKRFNPEGLAWLPILHTNRGTWHFTALFSNTARAHELGRTDDWVVVYFYDDHHQEGQNTIVTETNGPMTGERVVRGREAECRALAN